MFLHFLKFSYQSWHNMFIFVCDEELDMTEVIYFTELLSDRSWTENWEKDRNCLRFNNKWQEVARTERICRCTWQGLPLTTYMLFL